MGRRTAIAMGLLTVMTLIGWILLIGASFVIDDLEAKYDALNASYNKLKKEYEVLNSKYSELQDQYSSLGSEYSSLNVEYNSLKDEYERLKDEYECLKEKFEALKASLEKGEIIAGSATWLSEDKRLKVVSELIPKYLFGEISYYNIRVNVTNVSNKPLSEVLVFIFVYVNGKLAKWDYHRFEDLYIGETQTYTFTDLPEDVTTYKVLALGSE